MAYQSGFPITVTYGQDRSNTGAGFDRPNATGIDPKIDDPTTNRFFNTAAYVLQPFGTHGNVGRNTLIGPGLFNVDLSLSRSFGLRQLREGVRLTVRADAFNVLNHANLNNPDAFLGSSTFGIALYGRRGRTTGFPAVSPLNETARQVQLLVRLEF